jgi:hypothetical protein
MNNSSEFLRQAIDDAKRHRRPIVNWIGRSLEEIYLSGDFGIGRYNSPKIESP